MAPKKKVASKKQTDQIEPLNDDVENAPPSTLEHTKIDISTKKKRGGKPKVTSDTKVEDSESKEVAASQNDGVELENNKVDSAKTKRGRRDKVVSNEQPQQGKLEDDDSEKEPITLENDKIDVPKKKRGGKNKIANNEELENKQTEDVVDFQNGNKKTDTKNKRGGKDKTENNEQLKDTEPTEVQLENGSQELENNDAIVPKKKRGGKHKIEEIAHEKDIEKSEASHDVPKKKRAGKTQVENNVLEKDVEKSEVDSEVPKKKRGGKTQAAKEVAKSEPNASGSSDAESIEEPQPKKARTAKKKDTQPTKDASVPKKKKEANDSISFDCVKDNKNGDAWNLKISTWNIAGMRAWVKKDGLDYVTKEDADIICFQETKCPENKVPAEAKVEGYHTYWASGSKDGYAGVALYSKEKPISVTYGIGNKEHDVEGRAITAEYDKFYLVTTYVPNSGQGLKTLSKRMDWDGIFRQHLKDLDSKKPVILCGDLNVAHNEIDLANPKTNTKHAGFTPEERENMTTLLKEGFTDSFRELYPDKTGAYTFWTYMGNARSRNTGWRLDYFVVSERLMDSVCDVSIRSDVLGSDHCPVTLFVHI